MLRTFIICVLAMLALSMGLACSGFKITGTGGTGLDVPGQGQFKMTESKIDKLIDKALDAMEHPEKYAGSLTQQDVVAFAQEQLGHLYRIKAQLAGNEGEGPSSLDHPTPKSGAGLSKN